MNINRLSALIVGLGLLFALMACSAPEKSNVVYTDGPLPILGDKEEINGTMNYHTIPEFTFINQYADTITEETFANKVYIVDYFFTSCPTICPKVKDQELKIFDKFKSNNGVGILSVSIDPKYDTVDRLKWYNDRLEIEKGNWHLVTGEKDFIYDIADSFFHIAMEDPESPGGYDHDGRLVLVDRNKNIRSFCNGLDEEDVDRFILDIEKLLNEK